MADKTTDAVEAAADQFPATAGHVSSQALVDDPDSWFVRGPNGESGPLPTARLV